MPLPAKVFFFSRRFYLYYYIILVSTFCSDLDIKLVFTTFKIKSWFGVKDPIPAGLRSRVISCAGCST